LLGRDHLKIAEVGDGIAAKSMEVICGNSPDEIGILHVRQRTLEQRVPLGTRPSPLSTFQKDDAPGPARIVEKAARTHHLQQIAATGLGITAAERVLRSRSKAVGAHMPPQTNIQKNRLLTALPPEDFQRFFSELCPVPLKSRQIVYETGGPMEYIYFIQEGVASILTDMLNGSTVEVGMIGAEGMLGVAAMLGAETSAQQVIVQVGGTALRMDMARCRKAFDQSADVRRIMHRFTDVLLNLSSQTAACNRLHSVEQRCARWLLMASDRIQSLTLPMTHEFLASMLGVRRAGVTEVAGELQRSSLIRYQRGQLTIIDRDGLEETACECYRADRAGLDRLY
jgi:CRP-like cAMP-binding protein